MDIIFCICALPFSCFICIPITLCILVFDGKPIFYLSDRIGKKGEIFKMYKFRSMFNNAPDIRQEDGSTYNAKDDPRVTKIGKILRKTSLDEVPQLLNVLLGDMSIIGPRPFVPLNGKNNTSKDFEDRLKVKPGITGYTQAYFRNSISQDEKIRMDAEYARNVTFLGDIKILLKTIETVLQRKNIYNN